MTSFADTIIIVVSCDRYDRWTDTQTAYISVVDRAAKRIVEAQELT